VGEKSSDLILALVPLHALVDEGLLRERVAVFNTKKRQWKHGQRALIKRVKAVLGHQIPLALILRQQAV